HDPTPGKPSRRLTRLATPGDPASLPGAARLLKARVCSAASILVVAEQQVPSFGPPTAAQLHRRSHVAGERERSRESHHHSPVSNGLYDR
ncbi:MAG TPA: hypothetical protein VKE98_13860, partial [Gemmataceae bacterium]|nr:hypothetical protein [Gemmataceae bacterium]